MSNSCEVCERIARLTPESPYLIAELSTGYAVLADNQHIPGYTIFVCKTCLPELHDLAPDVRSRFLGEMAQVAEAVFRAFQPRKLNYARQLGTAPALAPLPSLRRRPEPPVAGLEQRTVLASRTAH